MEEQIGNSAADDPETARALAMFDSARSWRMAAAAFVAMFATYGIAYSFGAFFKPMAEEFGAGRASTSTVFSLTVFVWGILGWFAGHISDRFGPRLVLIAGAVAMGAGLIATSFINHLWTGYLTYSIGVGIGVASGYVPMLAVVGGWFLRRRNLALGFAVAGIGCGTIVGAPLAAAMIARLGWRETVLILGIGAMLLLLGCAAAVERPPIHVTPSAIDVRQAIRSPDFVLLYINWALFSIALFVPIVYLPAFAHDYGASAVAAAALVGLLGGASVLGRLCLGAIADRMSTLRLLQGCGLMVAISYLIWLCVSSYTLMLGFTIILGISYGGFVALSPAMLAEKFGIARLGTVIGVIYTGGGVGALLGPPIAGMIIDRTGSYRWAIAYSMVAAAIAFAVLIPIAKPARTD